MAEQGKKSKSSGQILGRRYRYTGDYQVETRLGAGGRREKHLIYTGEWIRPVMEDADYRRTVLVLRLLVGFAVLAVLLAVSVLPAPMTNKWYVPVLVASSFPLAYQIMGAVRMPARRQYMERQHYDKSFVRTGQSAMFAFVMMALSALGLLIYWIVASVGPVEGAAPYSLQDGAYAALLAAAMAAELVAHRRCRQIRTETVENSAFRP